MAHTKRIEELTQLFQERAPIARYFGMRLSYNDAGGAVVDLPYNPNLDHALGGVHGGVYATMLDCAGWFTAAATTDRSCWVATSEFTVHLLQPVQRSSLRATGRIVQVGKRQVIAEMDLKDGDGRLVGRGVGTFIVLPNLPTS